MDRMNSLMVVLAVHICLVLVLVQSAARKCPCVFTADQNKFCASDFVMKVNVISIKESAKQVIYAISKQKTYKLNNKDVNKSEIVTSGACRVKETTSGELIAAEKSYIISGMIVNNRLTMDQCGSIVMPASELNSQQLYNFKNNYKKDHCGCEVVTVKYQEDMQPSKADRNCVMLSISSSCFNQYAFCKQKGGVCNWKALSKSKLAGCAKGFFPFGTKTG